MLIDCLLLKQQISMFESSMMILINCLQNLLKFDFFSMIILCWFKWVINKSIISFLCSCIMINVYRTCVINFWSKISSYNWINFDFDSDINWISKCSHNSDIKDSSMKVMSVTSVFIRAKNLNIFSKLLKMTSTVNDVKSNESSNMLMKQNMSILFLVTTLMKADRFSNLQRFHTLKLFQDIHMLYVLFFRIWSKVLSSITLSCWDQDLIFWVSFMQRLMM